MPKFLNPRTTIAATLSLVMLTGGCAYLSGEGGSAGADPDSPECEPYKQWQDIGGTVSIYASIRDVEAERLERSWQLFTECTGIDIQYEGSGEFEAQVQVKVDGGNAPDIAFFPQPGLLKRFADAGSLDEQALMVGGDLARYGSERGRDATGEGGRDVHTTFLICLSTSSMP